VMNRGDRREEIVGSDEDRGQAILDWLVADDGVEGFVVIDDEPIDLEKLAHHLVLPNPQIGLQIHDVKRAVELLKGDRA